MKVLQMPERLPKSIFGIGMLCQRVIRVEPTVWSIPRFLPQGVGKYLCYDSQQLKQERHVGHRNDLYKANG